ncbi:MAG: choice-of-anchor tandem repeat GloVer-containing protein [Nitrospirota bacterium]
MHLRKGISLAVLATIIATGCITVSAQTLTTLHSFNGVDGSSPESALVQGSDGNFYGTTPAGGAHGKGTVFKIDAAGMVITLHSFSGSPGDGAVPVGGLVQGSDGNFYGTTASGGAFFQGTVFRMTPSGAITVLHSFNSFFSEGAVPVAGLVQGSDDNFYGTTAVGGDHFQGTVFELDAAGNLTTLHSFSGSPNDGANPVAGLVQGTDGNFYGTTPSGGEHFQGIVYRISQGAGFTVLHSFSGYPVEGGVPFAALVQGNDGNFYGTTAVGGTHFKGTVFKIDAAGTLSTLHSFSGSGGEGANPVAGLVQANDANFYGSTVLGGTNRRGTLFSIDATGNFTTLHSFSGSPNEGALPFAGVVQGNDGNLYGTTALGGTHGAGTVFTF